MGLIIDSNVWIESERGKFSLEDFLASRSEEPVAIAAITASELLHGVHRASRPTIREKRLEFVNRILEMVPVVPFDLPIAKIHAALWAELSLKGKTIGAHDLIIAATALQLGYSVVSFNVREFRVISKLDVLIPQP